MDFQALAIGHYPKPAYPTPGKWDWAMGYG